MLHPKQQHIVDIFGKEPETLDEVAKACIAVISANSTRVVGFAWTIGFAQEVSNSHNAPINGYTNWGGHDTRGDDRNYPGFGGRVWIRYAEDPDFMRCSDNFNKTLTYTGTGGGGSYNGPWDDISLATYGTRTRKDYRHRFVYKYPNPKCYSWDYRFFSSDFPALCTDPTVLLADEIAAFNHAEDEKVIWNKLQNTYYRREKFALEHGFEWTDPELKAADEKFLAECRANNKAGVV
jgi:hypothetical protein